MTEIFLHGVLAHEFGSYFKMRISKASKVLDAIDANRPKFLRRVSDLAREGLNYTLVVDGTKIKDVKELEIKTSPKEIHIVPLILGGGIVTGIITGIASVIGGATAAAATTAFFGTAIFGTALTWGTVIGSVVLTAISIGLQLLLAPKPDAGPPISATTKALQESFVFSNKANLANQGSPVPVGYGRLKVGSQVIQTSIKSFPQSRDSVDTMLQNPFRLSDSGNISTVQSNSSRL